MIPQRFFSQQFFRISIVLLSLYSSTLWACEVCPAGCSYYSIQAAVISASNGDTIEVCPGTYTENIDFMGKAVTLVSRDGPDTTIVDGGLNGSVATFDSGEGPESILEGFTLTNGDGTFSGLSYGGGIYCSGASPTIRNAHIIENSAAYGGGLYLNDCDATLESIVVRMNQSSPYDGAGIYSESSSPVISNSKFERNASLRQGGGIYGKSSTLTIYDSILDTNFALIFPSGKGGGIYLEDSELILNNSTLLDNAANDFGGGLYGDDGSEVSISGSTFDGNRVDNSGGGAYLISGAPMITNSVFKRNESGLDGAGLFLNQTAGQIVDSLFFRNRTELNGSGGGVVMLLSSTSITNTNITENAAGIAGGGIWIKNSSTPTVSDSIISLNSAGSDGAGVLVSEFSSPTFVNSVFHNNFVTGVLPGFGSGGALAAFSSAPVTLTNCTLRFNLASVKGGGLYSEFSDVVVNNSILWGNTPDQIDSFGASGAPVVTFSDIQGSYTGTGNINETPRFVNLFNSHLKSDSPVIDMGDPTTASTSDIDGDPRPFDDGIDMGADEYAGSVHPLPVVLANGASGNVDIVGSAAEDLVFTFSLDSRGRTDDSDWWVVFANPPNLLFLTPTGLTPEWTPLLQFPLLPFEAYDYPPISLTGVPEGAYTVYFAVDTRRDGILTWNDLYYDWVTVNLTH